MQGCHTIMVLSYIRSLLESHTKLDYFLYKDAEHEVGWKEGGDFEVLIEGILELKNLYRKQMIRGFITSF